MSRVLIIGAGGVAAVTVKKCARLPEYFDEIYLASRTVAKCEALQQEVGIDLVEGKPEAYSPFRPGMTATVDIITNRVDDAISVPISAIVIKNDTTATTGFGTSQYEAVFVKNGDKASLKRIKTGIQDDSNIVVSEGLETGDEVITGPYNTVTKLLKDGDMVEVKKDAKFGASEED